MGIGEGDVQSIGTAGWFVSQDPPVISLAIEAFPDVADGARYTISDSEAGVPTTCYAINGEGETLELGTIYGNDSEVFPLDAGPYWGYAVAATAAGNAFAGVYPFGVASASGCDVRSDFGDEFAALEVATSFVEFGEAVTVRRGIAAFQATAVLAPVITRYDDREGIDVAVGDSAWLIRVVDYDFGAGCTEPKKYDRIVTALGAEYEVVDPGDIDRERILWKIPTRRSEHR